MFYLWMSLFFHDWIEWTFYWLKKDHFWTRWSKEWSKAVLTQSTFYPDIISGSYPFLTLLLHITKDPVEADASMSVWGCVSLGHSAKAYQSTRATPQRLELSKACKIQFVHCLHWRPVALRPPSDDPLRSSERAANRRRRVHWCSTCAFVGVGRIIASCSQESRSFLEATS